MKQYFTNSDNPYTQYFMKRYKTEPEFRKRVIQSVIKYSKKHRPEINKKDRTRYAKRTPEQIKARAEKLRIMRQKGLWKK